MAKDVDIAPNPVDVHVGLRIRLRRKELGVSQEKLAEAIGLTFQQVQKYERAANRVSASKLYEVARALDTSTAYFFEGLTDAHIRTAAEPGGQTQMQAFLLTAEGVELPEQLEFLEGLGCHLYQGYLYSRPVPITEFKKLLE